MKFKVFVCTSKKINWVKLGQTNLRNSHERAASLVEYGLLVALIAVVALSAIKIFGENVSTSYSESVSAVAGAT